MEPRALVVGANGQDGILLSRLLQAEDVRTVGVVRPGADTSVLRRLAPSTELVEVDVTDAASMRALVLDVRPTYVVNLAAISSVGESWRRAKEVLEVNTNSVLELLESVRDLQGRVQHTVRYYQASSSEMFGRPAEHPQTEATALHPRSPYGVSKAAAHFLTINYRESYGLFTCSGILYNHESPLRPTRFVTRKITSTVARIALGEADELVLGNVDVERDWGHATDYVRAMWAMLQHDEPDDFVIATGRARPLLSFVEAAFRAAGIDDWEDRLRSDPALHRPAEVERLAGDASKAHRVLGWSPTTSFEDMVAEMVEHDMRSARGSGPDGA